jgi:hypothetical protein
MIEAIQWVQEIICAVLGHKWMYNMDNHIVCKRCGATQPWEL